MVGNEAVVSWAFGSPVITYRRPTPCSLSLPAGRVTHLWGASPEAIALSLDPAPDAMPAIVTYCPEVAASAVSRGDVYRLHGGDRRHAVILTPGQELSDRLGTTSESSRDYVSLKFVVGELRAHSSVIRVASTEGKANNHAM